MVIGAGNHNETNGGARPLSTVQAGARSRSKSGPASPLRNFSEPAPPDRTQEGILVHNLSPEKISKLLLSPVDQHFVRRCSEPPQCIDQSAPLKIQASKGDYKTSVVGVSPLSSYSRLPTRPQEWKNKTEKKRGKQLKPALSAPGAVPWNTSVLIEPWERKQRERAYEIPISPPLRKNSFLPESYTTPQVSEQQHQAERCASEEPSASAVSHVESVPEMQY
ncbi:hypothetical protein BESB_074300 [Besnoitia besnoiti]|uniref:Uncharacterized protein n=1 Tax=Besnoitia besnoiti TaxID=94643 RepID=A0A2A9M738_BESBE|nr:uncharacterized protein BESB_074300 [Besnoitia besnoiti]PFH34278.1 hypothetical protein BESB_074300 [Besnoitia besnoiti]